MIESRNILLMLIACGWGGTVVAESVPFDDPRWQFQADGADIVQFEGQKALRLDGGRAWLPDVSLTDGIIEFDIAFGSDRAFSGAMFRFQRPGDFENFYFRPHQSGMPDSSQYTPEVNGVSGWQLYFGPEYSAPFTYRYNEWMHVIIAFKGSRAIISLDGETLLVSSLKRPVQAGMIGLRSGFAPAHYANFSYSAQVPEDFAAHDFKPYSREPIPGLIRSWRISEALATDALGDSDLASMARDVDWKTVEIEPEGFVNLAWSEGVDRDHRMVLAEIDLPGEAGERRLVRFGYSDRVRVYFNDLEVYRGDNGYQTRDYRYLGTIGLFDAIPVTLVPGRNRLTFAVSESFGGWGVMAAVE